MVLVVLLCVQYAVCYFPPLPPGTQSHVKSLLRSHFNLTGDSATPSLEACRDVLAAHSETFIGRTVGDVKDKARNLALKLKKAANNI